MTTIVSNNPGVSVTPIGAVTGGVAGSPLLVLALFLLVLALIWMTKKYKRAVSLLHEQKHPEGKEQRETIHQVEQQHQYRYDEDMEMKSNDAYISTTRQIPTEDNIAYGQIESDHNLLSDECEYDYI